MDFNMPIMNGAEAISQIVQSFNKVENEGLQRLSELLSSKWLPRNKRRNSTRGLKTDELVNPIQRICSSNPLDNIDVPENMR